jgi:hypothetical protein
MTDPWWLPQHRELRALAGEPAPPPGSPVAVLDGCPACLVPVALPSGTWKLYRPVGQSREPYPAGDYRYQSLGLRKYPHAVERFSDAPALFVKQPRSTADVILAEPIARVYKLALPWLWEQPGGFAPFLRWLFAEVDRATLERVWTVALLLDSTKAARETLTALSPLRRPSTFAA